MTALPDNAGEKAIFEEAFEKRSYAARVEFLDAACAGNPPLRARLDELFAACADGDTFMSRPAPARDHSNAANSEELGTQIGRYKLVKKIGEGGCGIVYLAEQQEPLRRRVALKVIKAGMDTRSVIARFEAERQALALMDHPNIAKILDAGSTIADRPYFVMELVEGIKITNYCAEKNLSIPDRLRLFLQVCDAVQHAHQKGIIHRDLKPSNILLATPSAETASLASSAIPKIIDFGIAKALQGKLANHTIHTGLHHLIGTPAYMSPEQAQMSTDIDTRTDIYSLGVLLYELLTGKPPFDNHELLTAGVDEMRRIIGHVEPKRPSAVRIKPSATIIFPSPGIETDLDWIVMKCLEKDRSRRYESAGALAADIHRYLQAEPIVARPPSFSYRARRFVARNKAASTAAGAVAGILVVSFIVVTRALSREKTTHAKAVAQLSAATDFISVVFDKVAPEIEDLSGASRAQSLLAHAGLKFVQEVQALNTNDAGLRFELARRLLKTSLTENPGRANTTGNFQRALEEATAACELLRLPLTGVDEADRLHILFWAEWARVKALYGLGRWQEGVAQTAELESALERLSRYTRFKQQYIERQRACIRINAGGALSVAGQPQTAIDRYFAPYFVSAWASQFNESTCEEYELTNLAGLYDGLTQAYLFLGQFDKMLIASTNAHRIARLLSQRFPRNSRYAWGEHYSRAHNGFALARTADSAVGLSEIVGARRELERIAAVDPFNDQFTQCQATVNALHAWALSHGSKDGSISERLQRLREAEESFARAEQLSRKAKFREPEVYLKLAGAELSAAKLLHAARSSTDPPN